MMFRINGDPVTVKRYPDETLRLDIEVDSEKAMVEWLYEKDEEMTLFFIVRHLRDRLGVVKLTLRMPYIPNARMDRVKNRGEVFTLKYFCEFINSLCFDEVIIRDAHSDISLALLNKIRTEPVGNVIERLASRLLNPQKDIVFYPDEGSSKRYSDTLEFPCAFGMKKRDWETGSIMDLDVCGNIPVPPFDVLIVDDISSYGGTFLSSARKLKELGAVKVYLYVTHCENAILKGDLINSGLIERIYTTESIFTGDHPLIEILRGERYE